MASLSFLERSPRVMGVFGLLFLSGMVLTALFLQGGFFTPTYGVTAVFSDAAGVQPGDRVTVAGLPAGQVEVLAIRGGSVHVHMSVEESVALPDDSRAEVIIETLLGRRSVALHAGGSLRSLEDGAVIPLSRTTTPVDIIELNDVSVDLLEASDAEAFDAFLGDLAEITEGKTEDVRTLIQGLNKVTAAVDARKTELKRLITNLRILAETLGSRDAHLAGLIDDLDLVLANLAQRQEQIRVLLETTASSSGETADLVSRNRATLNGLLTGLHTDLQVIDDHQLDLAATISYLEKAVQGYSSVGYSGDVPNEWANIFVQSLGPAGVDPILGEGGRIDQLFDQLFCNGACPPSTSSGATTDRSPAAVDAGAEASAEIAPPDPGLPCGLPDLIDRALADPSTPGRCGG